MGWWRSCRRPVSPFSPALRAPIPRSATGFKPAWGPARPRRARPRPGRWRWPHSTSRRPPSLTSAWRRAAANRPGRLRWRSGRGAVRPVLEPRFDASRLRPDPVDDRLNVVARRVLRLNQPIGVSARAIRVRAAGRDEPPFGQKRLDQGEAAQRYPLAFQGRPDRLVVLVSAQDALRLDAAEPHGMKPVGPLQPWAIGVVIFDENVVCDGVRVEAAHAERGMGDGRDRFAEESQRS